MKKGIVIAVLLLLAGCATRPVLYPNAHLKQVGEEQAQRDIAQCQALAEQYIQSDAGVAAAKSTAAGAAGGAVIGGVAGAFDGSFGRGLGMGAALGGAIGLVHGMFGAAEPSPVYKNFVTRCLTERGYEAIGWQ